MNNLQEKIQAFAQQVETEQIERLKAEGLGCEGNLIQAKTKIKEGKKYTKVDVGCSGKFMIDDSGNIFGIKAYGVIHRGHHYGTLDTTNEWSWGDYAPIRKRC